MKGATSACVCDSMAELGRYKRIEFRCPQHGDMAIDDRHMDIKQAPDPIAVYTAAKMSANDAERRREQRHPDFRRPR